MVRTMSTGSTKSDSLGKERKTIPYKIVILGDGGVGKSGKNAWLIKNQGPYHSP